MPKWSVRQYRGYNDFRYGTFESYVTETEIVIRGKLKKGNSSLYVLITQKGDDSKMKKGVITNQS